MPKADRIYVIAGKDESLVGARCQELLDELLSPEQRMTGLFSVDGDEAAIAEVLDELRTTPFLTDQRVVAVRGADGFVSKHRDLLEKYFEKPAATGILVLTVSGWDARTRLSKMLPKVGTLIELTPPPPWKLAEHLMRYAAGKHQLRLNQDAAETVVELIGEELAQLYNEVDKLALFARGETTIRVDHVESLIGHNRVYGAFEVIDAMIAGNTGQAVSRLRNMFEEDKSSEYSVVGAFAFHVRRMFQAKVLVEKNTSRFAIAKQLKIRKTNEDRFFAQLQRTSLTQIATFLEELAAIDHTTKTGQGQTPILIEQLVLKLAGSGTMSARTRL